MSRSGAIDPAAAEDLGRPTFSAFSALLAAACLGRGIHLRDGLIHGPSFPWLAAACLLALLPWLVPSRVRERGVSETLFVGTAGLVLAAQFASLLRARLLSGIAREELGPEPWWIRATIAAAAVASAAVVFDWKPRRAFAVAVAAAAVVGAWTLIVVPRPFVDVWHFQQEGCAALLRGESPFAATIPDLYGDVDGYGPGRVRDGRVLVGFQYPPLVLLVDIGAYLLAGDYRFAQLAAWLGAAALFAACGGRTARLAALLLLFTPRAFYLLEWGWPEPTLALLLAALTYATTKRPTWTPWIVGLLFASRQYLVVAAPLALLLVPPPRSLRSIGVFAAKAATIAAVVTLPFYFWNPHAFAESVWRAQSEMAPRADSLTFLALIASCRGGVFPPYWIGFAASFGAVALALVRGFRSSRAFAVALGAALLLFFAFNKFGRCNYYVGVLAALAAASSQTTRSRPSALPR